MNPVTATTNNLQNPIPTVNDPSTSWLWSIVDRFFEGIARVSSSIPKVIGTTPPSGNKPLLRDKTTTRTFNHTHEFAIEGGALWYRPRIEQHPWKPLPFQIGVKPIFIDVDGANLSVLDERKIVHFKKVLEEGRSDEGYHCADIVEHDNWRDRWCVLPFLHPLINLITEKMLRLPQTVKSVSISHRGRYNDYVVDAAGQKHFSNIGVTHLFALDGTGRIIHKHDAWSPPWSKTEMHLPETATTYFVGEKIRSSASTLMVIGYEVNKLTGTKTLKVLTRLTDIDLDGGNPTFRYNYFPDEYGDQTWVLPVDPKWKEHPFEPGQKVTDIITITQTGEGNLARRLTVRGSDQNGFCGYYEKNLQDSNWTFHPDALLNIEEHLPHELEESDLHPSQVHDYTGIYQSGQLAGRVKIYNFGNNTEHQKVEIYCGEKVHQIDLYARYCFLNFLGFEGKSYELVLPDDEDLKTLFGNRRVISVSVRKGEGDLKISSGFWSQKWFTLSLTTDIE